MEEELTTHSSILAWKIPWSEEPGELQSMALQKSQTQPGDYKEARVYVCVCVCIHTHTHIYI